MRNLLEALTDLMTLGLLLLVPALVVWQVLLLVLR